MWAVPFIPQLWKQQGWLLGGLLRLGFEVTYTMNCVRRFLTLPLRRRVPDFYIVGFPKVGGRQEGGEGGSGEWGAGSGEED